VRALLASGVVQRRANLRMGGVCARSFTRFRRRKSSQTGYQASISPHSRGKSG
jgi:hypothetical protein